MRILLRILALVAVVAVPVLLTGCASETTPTRQYYVPEREYFASNLYGPDAQAADWDLYEDQPQYSIEGRDLSETPSAIRSGD